MKLAPSDRALPESPVQPVSPLKVAVLLIAVALVVYVLGSWVRLLIAGAETIEDKDWVGFYRVGWLFWHGGLTRLYTDVVGSQQPLLNPPFFVWLCAPLALWTSPWPAYLICAMSAVVGSLVAVRVAVAVRSRGVGRKRALTAGLALVASAPWLGCVMTGQLSGLLLGLLMGALGAWHRGKPLAAGLILAGLAIKPNILLPIAMLFVIGRHWRVVAGVGLGIIGLLVSTVPLGGFLWSDYRAASVRVAGYAFDGTLAPWMHQTLLAFWIWAAGAAHRVDLAWLGWVVTTVAASLVVVRTWWKARHLHNAARLFGQAVLYMVAVNPYLFYYDGLLLAVPALVWYLDSESFASAAHWRACGACLLAIFVWQQVGMFAHYEGCPPLVGPLCLLWLLLDTHELNAARRLRTPEVRALRE